DLATELADRQDLLERQRDRLKAGGRKVGQTRKALAQQRTLWSAEEEAAQAVLAEERADLEQFRDQTVRLGRQLPELEQRAQGAVEGLARAREQLRKHLAELHAYARQSHEDLEGLRVQVQA